MSINWCCVIPILPVITFCIMGILWETRAPIVRDEDDIRDKERWPRKREQNLII